MPSRIAIVLARGGSVRLPGKNMLQIGGRTLVEIALQTALESSRFDDVVLFSDIDQAKALAMRMGGVLIVDRPAELSGPDALAPDACIYILESLGREYDIACLLNPTSPLRTPDDVQKTLDLLDDQRYLSSLSVTTMKFIPMLSNDGLWSDGGAAESKAKQGTTFIQNGAVYAVRTSILKQSRKFISDSSAVHVMPQERSVDIDTIWDFLAAEAYHRAMKT